MNNANSTGRKNSNLVTALRSAKLRTSEARTVAHALSFAGHATAVEIAASTGLHLTTVYFTLNHLNETHIAREQSISMDGHRFWCLTKVEHLAA